MTLKLLTCAPQVLSLYTPAHFLFSIVCLFVIHVWHPWFLLNGINNLTSTSFSSSFFFWGGGGELKNLRHTKIKTQEYIFASDIKTCTWICVGDIPLVH